MWRYKVMNYYLNIVHESSSFHPKYEISFASNAKSFAIAFLVFLRLSVTQKALQ